ncbi:HK97-gp10 family putative phage morphogenesis protein [Sandarakinorhabdus sp. DWP1-3-1]|uniref:HK97-gp10 family putative phage morphogenesis protein n=1 Tax=Sandarakinorhabdus sp. DWP1-3-1 TaxID=2804627 RepID=UPI003CF1BE94
MVRIVGAAKASQRIRSLGGPDAVRLVGAALFTGGERITTDAQISITRGSISGKNHVPSAPGDAPNNDTGVLANNIETVQTGPLKVTVSSNAPYSIELENGTSKMAARPFMRPAAIRNRDAVTELVRRAVNKALRR